MKIICNFRGLFSKTTFIVHYTELFVLIWKFDFGGNGKKDKKVSGKKVCSFYQKLGEGGIISPFPFFQGVY